MYHVYNNILRDIESCGEVSSTANRYPTTIQLIVSGIRKLCTIAKMPEGGAVFRGLSGLALPHKFFKPDEQGCAGGVEASFMSTTLSEEVARKHSGVNEGLEATIFRLELGKTSLGADITWLSQFPGEKEMLFAPRTHLQIVGKPVRSDDGISVVTLWPTAFQKIRTVEEVEKARREDMMQLASSLVWDIRNAAAQDGELDSALAQRLDALEQKLLAGHCQQEPGYYNDNLRYKSQFQLLLREAATAREQVRDSTSFLSRSLAQQQQQAQASVQDASNVCTPPAVPELMCGADVEIHSLVRSPELNGVCGKVVVPQDPGSGRWGVKIDSDGRILALKPANLVLIRKHASMVPQPTAHHVSGSTSEVSALHSKFTQDPNFKGVRGKFAADELFAAGIDGIVGPLDVQFIRAMYNEHCLNAEASKQFSAWNAGHEIKTTPEREWLFVVGRDGLDKISWTFDVERAEPVVGVGMMVEGRNAEKLAALLQFPEVQRSDVTVAEIVALRLYTGPMYVKYNAVLRGMAVATAGGTIYSSTVHLICSGLHKLSRVSELPKEMKLYRGNGGMALPSSFLEPDASGCAGGTEPAIMSATPDRSVALGYSGIDKDKDLPTL
jgi:hypothetical protein